MNKPIDLKDDTEFWAALLADKREHDAEAHLRDMRQAQKEVDQS